MKYESFGYYEFSSKRFLVQLASSTKLIFLKFIYLRLHVEIHIHFAAENAYMIISDIGKSYIC